MAGQTGGEAQRHMAVVKKKVREMGTFRKEALEGSEGAV